MKGRIEREERVDNLSRGINIEGIAEMKETNQENKQDRDEKV